MSRISSGTRASAAAPAAPAAAPEEATLALGEPAALDTNSVFQNTSAESSTAANLGDVHSCQIVVDTTATATELSLGKTISLSDNISKVFSQGAPEAVDSNKVIITGIDLVNVYSDVPRRVTVGMNLFDSHQQKQGLKNDAGWLYSQTSSDLADNEHVSSIGDDGSFTNLCSLLPNEKARHEPAASLYTPTHNTLTSRHMVDYNGISQEEQLWEGIVPVTKDLYYVPQDSVVCKVVSKNWDRFGFHPDQEQLVEDGFYRISKPIVNSVISQLWTQVISRMPYTTVSNMKMHLQSNIAPSSKPLNVSMQLRVKYRFPSVVDQ
jgi:hypothetical protein